MFWMGRETTLSRMNELLFHQACSLVRPFFTPLLAISLTNMRCTMHVFAYLILRSVYISYKSYNNLILWKDTKQSFQKLGLEYYLR